jgi:hypothetical protein
MKPGARNMLKANVMNKILTDLCNEHGLAYLDIYFAKHFAEASGQQETDVLNVIRRQEKISLGEDSGKGKYERARERACRLLADGWDNYNERAGSPAELLARSEYAYAYGVLCKKGLDKED